MYEPDELKLVIASDRKKYFAVRAKKEMARSRRRRSVSESSSAGCPSSSFASSSPSSSKHSRNHGNGSNGNPKINFTTLSSSDDDEDTQEQQDYYVEDEAEEGIFDDAVAVDENGEIKEEEEATKQKKLAMFYAARKKLQESRGHSSSGGRQRSKTVSEGAVMGTHTRVRSHSRSPDSAHHYNSHHQQKNQQQPQRSTIGHPRTSSFSRRKLRQQGQYDVEDCDFMLYDLHASVSPSPKVGRRQQQRQRSVSFSNSFQDECYDDWEEKDSSNSGRDGWRNVTRSPLAAAASRIVSLDDSSDEGGSVQGNRLSSEDDNEFAPPQHTYAEDMPLYEAMSCSPSQNRRNRSRSRSRSRSISFDDRQGPVLGVGPRQGRSMARSGSGSGSMGRHPVNPTKSDPAAASVLEGWNQQQEEHGKRRRSLSLCSAGAAAAAVSGEGDQHELEQEISEADADADAKSNEELVLVHLLLKKIYSYEPGLVQLIADFGCARPSNAVLSVEGAELSKVNGLYAAKKAGHYSKICRDGSFFHDPVSNEEIWIAHGVFWTILPSSCSDTYFRQKHSINRRNSPLNGTWFTLRGKESQLTINELPPQLKINVRRECRMLALP